MQDATVNTRESRQERGARAQLVLRWLFPDAARPVLPILNGFSIGRDPSCLLVLNGEGVSRVHAEVRKDGSHFSLRDNGSTNGTFLRGQQITEARIEPGSIL